MFNDIFLFLFDCLLISSLVDKVLFGIDNGFV